MGQVSVALNGRTYRLECSEGEESHLIELAEYLGSHVAVSYTHLTLPTILLV